jgi:hypothetical protein
VGFRTNRGLSRATPRVLKKCERAKSRIADEYDAADVQGQGRPKKVPDGNVFQEPKATLADIGLTRKQVHEARRIRDAEKVALRRLILPASAAVPKSRPWKPT